MSSRLQLLQSFLELINLYVSAKDAVATMIKRLAHRNANVQLYTLEVSPSPTIIQPRHADSLTLSSLQMPSHKTVDLQCIESWLRDHLQRRYCAWQMTGYVAGHLSGCP